MKLYETTQYIEDQLFEAFLHFWNYEKLRKKMKNEIYKMGLKIPIFGIP
jgi:hypothetical protein